jgi:hypothetical protein
MMLNGDIHKSRFQKEKESELLHYMNGYGTNQVDCRRCLLLRYFGEEFTREKCHGTCDNCKHRLNTQTPIRQVDYTEDARHLGRLVRRISDKRKGNPFPTLDHLTKVFEGRDLKKIRDCGDNTLPEYGKGQHLRTNVGIVARLIDRLEKMGVVEQCSRKSGEAGYFTFYRPGRSIMSLERSFGFSVILDERQENPTPPIVGTENGAVTGTSPYFPHPNITGESGPNSKIGRDVQTPGVQVVPGSRPARNVPVVSVLPMALAGPTPAIRSNAALRPNNETTNVAPSVAGLSTTLPREFLQSLAAQIAPFLGETKS